MPHYKKLVGDKCYLSPCSSDDAEKWTEWDNDLLVAIPFGDEAYTPHSLEKNRNILDYIAQNQKHTFDILDIQTDAVIGRCMLFDIDYVNRRATLAIVIGEKDYWGRGYGQEAVRLLLDYGFNLLNLNNIMLWVMSFNKRAINCYKRVGFREIGRRRQSRIIGGEKYDIVFMDILAEEISSFYVKECLENYVELKDEITQ